MNNKFCYFSFIFSICALTHPLAADYCNDAQMRNLDYRMQALEAKRNSCALVNPAARPTQKCDWGGYVTVDPLLLKAQENGLEFAVESFDAGTPILSGKSRAKSIDFNWNWGFRAGLGANLPHDGWDIYLDWMRLRAHAHRSLHAGFDEFLLPVWAHPGGSVQGDFGNDSATGASSRWKLHLNEIDLNLGRQFFVSKWLTLKPHAGFRTAWINQKDRIKYKGLSENPAATGEVDMKCKYWGLGVNAGLNTQWGLACGFSLIADYSASLLYGYFNSFHNENMILGDVSTNDFTFRDFYHVGRIITDFLIGLRYDYLFDNETYHLGIQAGWEHHMYFGQNQFIRFSASDAPGNFFANQGDLTLQGFSAQVRFDF